MSETAVAPPGDHIQITTDPWTEGFWSMAKESKLTACQCGACGTFRMPPSPFCPNCQSQEVRWPELPGTGTVYSFVVCHRSPFPDVADYTYVPVVLELDGAPGVRLISNLIDVDPDEVRIGMRVQVLFHTIQDGWKAPIFRPLD